MSIDDIKQERLALKPDEAAIALGISTRLLWSLIANNQIPFKRINRRVLLPVDSLRAWLLELDGSNASE